MKITFKPGVPIASNHITLGRKLEKLLYDLGVESKYDESCYDGIRIRNYKDNQSVIDKVATLINMDASNVRNSVEFRDAVIVSSHKLVLNTEIDATI